MASNVLPFEAQAAVKQTAALERTADAITDTKAELVALDHRRQQTREALREIRQGNGTDKAWLAVEGQFFRFSKDEAISSLEHQQQLIEAQYNKTQAKLKDHVKQLQRLQGQPLNQGFDLKPMAKQDLHSIAPR